MKSEPAIDPAAAAAPGCPHCGAADLQEEEISSAYWLGGRLVVVEGIPALVCQGCGERLYADGVVMALDLMRGRGFPDGEAVRHLHVPVFRFGVRAAEPGPCPEPDE